MLSVIALVCITSYTDCTKSNIEIIDGDSIVVRSKGFEEEFRILGIDAPEIKGHCKRESALAQMAKQRLMTMLKKRAVNIRRYEEDKYGRTLATLEVNNSFIGNKLIEEGLARQWTEKWDGNRYPWC